MRSGGPAAAPIRAVDPAIVATVALAITTSPPVHAHVPLTTTVTDSKNLRS
jgi:hypothetical protein